LIGLWSPLQANYPRYLSVKQGDAACIHMCRCCSSVDSRVTKLQANYLRSVGVEEGDTVCIYMPML